MVTIITIINASRAGVAAEPLLRFLIRIALALLTTLAKKLSLGPYTQFENSTSYTTRHEYQGGLCAVSRCQACARIRSKSGNQDNRHALRGYGATWFLMRP